MPKRPREEPAAATEDEADVFEVKSILRSKKVRGKDFFLVEWAGYPREMATWEAASNIIDKSLIAEFLKAKKRGKHPKSVHKKKIAATQEAEGEVVVVEEQAAAKEKQHNGTASSSSTAGKAKPKGGAASKKAQAQAREQRGAADVEETAREEEEEEEEDAAQPPDLLVPRYRKDASVEWIKVQSLLSAEVFR